jgi:hypothetical protein
MGLVEAVTDLIERVAVCPVVFYLADAPIVGLDLFIRDFDVRDLVVGPEETCAPSPQPVLRGCFAVRRNGRHVVSPRGIKDNQSMHTHVQQ